MTVDAVCRRAGGRWKKAFLRPFFYCELPAHDLVLMKPMTYMNRSGDILPSVQRRYGQDLERLLVVVDNLDLPVGGLRIKPKGSSAGHNGLKSLMQWAGSGEFSRLYIGIGRGSGVIDHVLGEVGAAERPQWDFAIETAASACLIWADSGLTAAAEHLRNTHE